MKKCVYCRTSIDGRVSATCEACVGQKELREKARHAVSEAIRKGTLVPQPCQECGDLKSQGHHPDYSKPLEVQWLCYPHHLIAHNKVKRERPATGRTYYLMLRVTDPEKSLIHQAAGAETVSSWARRMLAESAIESIEANNLRETLISNMKVKK